MKLKQLLLGTVLAIPFVNAQSITDSSFFIVVLSPIILLLIAIFIFLAGKKMLSGIK